MATERRRERAGETHLRGTEGVRTLAAGVHILPAQGNGLAVETEAGVVLVDSGPGGTVTDGMIQALRGLTDAPVLAICYSHGHAGYNAGVPQWQQHAADRGDPPPRLIAHANALLRYRRYRETLGLQRLLHGIQFPYASAAQLERILALVDPTETFREHLVIGTRGRVVELLWAPSETDDAIALWLPAERVLYGSAATPGASIPNVGTPLRTQRFTLRWAETLERMAALGAEQLVQEFGPVTAPASAVHEQLTTMARALRWVRAEVVARMNRGMTDVEILHDLEAPPELFDHAYMRPVYGAFEYIVRDLYREENGWWGERNPTQLHPSHPDAAATAVLSALGDPAAVLRRARALAQEGQTQLALHVVDLLALAPGDAPELTEARALKADLCVRRAGEVTPYVSKALYGSSAKLLRSGRRRWSEAAGGVQDLE